MKNRYSTLAYPQSNGTKEMWAEELPSVLWAYWTTPRRSMGETPFSLTYGGEAVIPTEVRLCSARVSGFVPAENEELMIKQLDLLEEYQELATIRLAEYQQMLARQYDKEVKSREFSVGDLVLGKAMGNAQDASAGKLAPNWEGPYRVIAIAGGRAYYLKDMDERPLPSMNVQNLRRFYH